LLSHGSRVVEDRQPDHTHDGNMSESLARMVVGEIKKAMVDTECSTWTGYDEFSV